MGVVTLEATHIHIMSCDNTTLTSQIVMVPSMKTKKKEKITDTVNQRIKKAFIIRVKVPGELTACD